MEVTYVVEAWFTPLDGELTWSSVGVWVSVDGGPVELKLLPEFETEQWTYEADFHRRRFLGGELTPHDNIPSLRDFQLQGKQPLQELTGEAMMQRAQLQQLMLGDTLGFQRYCTDELYRNPDLLDKLMQALAHSDPLSEIGPEVETIWRQYWALRLGNPPVEPSFQPDPRRTLEWVSRCNSGQIGPQRTEVMTAEVDGVDPAELIALWEQAQAE